MSSLVAIAGDDNVIVDALIDSYVIEERNGVPVAVRNVEKIFYNAQRYDDKAVGIIGYGGSVSIDKVSAPGAKPVYRQWIDNDVFYKDSRICFVELPVKQGKTVKVEFHRTFKKPEQFCKITMASLYYVRNYTVEVTVPAMLVSRIKVSPYNLASNVDLTSETDDKGTKTYRVSISDFRPLKNEELAPALSVAAPALLVTGILDGLDGVYDFLKGYVPDKPIAISVKKMAEEITTGIYNDIDKAEAIASWVRQNIRYVAIEHGEWAYRPDDAENTLAKRYGDCKCSANLIKAMLCSVGIDGRFCWIGTAHTVPHDWKKLTLETDFFGELRGVLVLLTLLRGAWSDPDVEVQRLAAALVSDGVFRFPFHRPFGVENGVAVIVIHGSLRPAEIKVKSEACPSVAHNVLHKARILFEFVW